MRTMSSRRQNPNSQRLQVKLRILGPSQRHDHRSRNTSRAQPLEIAMELKDPNCERGQCNATVLSERQAPTMQTVWEWWRFVRVTNSTE